MSSSRQDEIPAAQLAGNFCQTLFYGMYLVSCAFCVRTLLLTGSGREERWRRLSEIRWLMAVVFSILFVISTYDVALGVVHNFQAFIKSDDPRTVFFDLASSISIIRSVDQIVAMIIGDFVLIYRCWAVYGRRWLVIVPSLVLYLAGISMGVKMIQIETNMSSKSEVDYKQIKPWFLSFWVITAVQNILTTTTLIWRIWRVENLKEREKFTDRSHGPTANRPRHLRKVIRVITESGAAYTLMVLLTFVVGSADSTAAYPTSDITLQMTGITFNVILIRSSAHRDEEFTVFDQNEQLAFTASEQRSGISPTLRSINIISRPSRPQGVELAILTHHHGDKQRSQADPDIYPRGMGTTKTAAKT